MARKHRRRNAASDGTTQPPYSLRSVIVAMVSFLCLVGVAVIYSSNKKETQQSKRIFHSPHELPSSLIRSLDAVIVLGGGAPSAVEEPPAYVQQRADDAAQIVRRFEEMTLPGTKAQLSILCLSAGTAHVPQLLSPDGLPIWESTATAAYLQKKHKMVENVYVETTSYDTIGNAFFARTSHTDINGWRNLLVVTNEFHMTRTAAIFDWIFIGCTTTTQTSFQRGGGEKYNLFFLSSLDTGLEPEAIEARIDREMESTRNVQENLSKKFTSLSSVWKFLHSEHALYTASKLVERGRGSIKDATASDLVRKSYGLKPS